MVYVRILALAVAALYALATHVLQAEPVSPGQATENPTSVGRADAPTAPLAVAG